jgi:hypothetical protein
VTATVRDYVFGMVGRPRSAAGLLLLIIPVALVLAAALLGPYPSLLRGWLLGFAVWSCAPIGSMALLLIHRLTGGRWGVAISPVVRPLAAMMPLVAIAFLPVLAGLPHIYPWAADPSQIKPDVARWYLSEPLFVVRSLIALVGWSVLGVVFAAGAGGRLMAALGLAFFGLTISLVAVDWYLSLEPRYVATAFAAMVAIQQLLVALAVAGLLGSSELEGKVAGDIGGLLIATLLGVVYLDYMTYVVAWYGDLPDKAEWFLKRGTTPWMVTLVVLFILGAVLPFAMLLVKSVRTSRSGLRIASLLILIGTALHFGWLLVPAFTAQRSVIATGVVALAVLTAASILIARDAAAAEARHAE